MTASLVLLVELVVLFLGVTFLVEILQRRLGDERLRVWMGGTPVIAALKGITIGFITPFCTYSAIPLLVGMRRASVPPAGYIAFIAAAPVLDPILFGALWLIVGPTVAITYVLVTFIAAMALALVAQHIGAERYLKPLPEPVPATTAVPLGGHQSSVEGSCATDGGSSGASPPWQGWSVEWRPALVASVGVIRSFGPLLLLGVVIGVAIEAAVPPKVAARITTGSPWVSIPAAAAIGTPLYFNTELFVPIANSLNNAGVGVGAIVALTIAGAGANLPEFIVLSKMARSGAVSIFFGYVFVIAMVGGLLAHGIAG